MSLSIEERDRLADKANNIAACASNYKINQYYRAFFAQRDVNEGSPYPQDDHVGQLGWGQE
jgi:hypothetical protein